MQEQLAIIIEELKRLRYTGVETVYIADDTLKLLQSRLAPPPKITRERIQPLAAQKPSPTSTKLEHPSQTKPKPKLSKSLSVAPVPQKITVKTASAPKASHSLPDPPQFSLPDGDKKMQMEWLRKHILDCPTCKKNVRPNKKIVIGVGELDADLFFCGEAPGAEEEEVGEPFVGPAGQLLTRIIEAMGLKRDQVYIGNIMNWRPETPNYRTNRPPSKEEMSFCLPYLKAQLEIVQPKVIVALGLTAVNGLLGYDANRKLGSLRGQWQTFETTPLMVTYHPSYLLRNNSKKVKRIVWEDMLKVMERLEFSISQQQKQYFL